MIASVRTLTILIGTMVWTYGILVEKADTTTALLFIDINDFWNPMIGKTMITVSVIISPVTNPLSHRT